MSADTYPHPGAARSVPAGQGAELASFTIPTNTTARAFELQYLASATWQLIATLPAGVDEEPIIGVSYLLSKIEREAADIGRTLFEGQDSGAAPEPNRCTPRPPAPSPSPQGEAGAAAPAARLAGLPEFNGLTIPQVQILLESIAFSAQTLRVYAGNVCSAAGGLVDASFMEMVGQAAERIGALADHASPTDRCVGDFGAWLAGADFVNNAAPRDPATGAEGGAP